MKKKFDAAAWLAKSGKKVTDSITSNQVKNIETESDMDVVIQRIEEVGVDITDGYKNWLELGFALSDELGENGRGYFHRISRFNPEYSPAEADRQYDNCLKSKGSGITIRSFFQRAKESGINISTSHSSYSSVLNNGNESSAGSARVIPPNDGFEECEEIEEALPTFAQAVLDRCLICCRRWWFRLLQTMMLTSCCSELSLAYPPACRMSAASTTGERSIRTFFCL